jgi:hypothetical protein
VETSASVVVDTQQQQQLAIDGSFVKTLRRLFYCLLMDIILKSLVVGFFSPNKANNDGALCDDSEKLDDYPGCFSLLCILLSEKSKRQSIKRE